MPRAAGVVEGSASLRWSAGRAALVDGLAALAAAALYLRLCAAHTPTYLFYWDSAQYGLAVLHFDPAAHRPQPPGYPLFVLVCRLATWLKGDVTAGVLAASAFGGLCTVLLTFLLLRTLLGRWQAVVGGLLVALSPLLWSEGQLPLPYTWASAGAAASVLCSLRAASRRTLSAAVGAGLVWGMCTGLRPELAWLLLPAMVAISFLKTGGLDMALRGREPAAPSRQRGLPRSLLALVVAAAALGVGAAWVAYCAASSGGWAIYVSAAADVVSNVRTLPGRAAVGTLERQQSSFRLGWLLAFGLAWPLAGAALLSSRRRQVLVTALPWTLVPAAFYGLAYCGRRGYLCVLVPPMVLLMVAGVDGLTRRLSGRTRALAVCCLTLVAARLLVTYAHLNECARETERAVAHELAAARSLDPPTTLLLVWGEYRVFSFHLPAHRVWWLAGLTARDRPPLRGRVFGSHLRRDTFGGRWIPMPASASSVRLPSGIRRLVAFDSQYARTLRGATMTPAVIQGVPVWTLDVGTARRLWVRLGAWGLK